MFMHPGGGGGGGRRACGGDLIVLVGPWVGHMTDPFLSRAREFFNPQTRTRLRPIIDRSYVSHFTQCAVRSGNCGNQCKVNA